MIVSTGTRTSIRNGVTIRETGSLTDRFYTEDVVGNRDVANYFTSVKTLWDRPPTVTRVVKLLNNGESSNVNFPYTTNGVPAHLPALTSMPSYADAVTMAAAHSNPSKPTVSVPVFIAQLKDFPKSLQRYGERKAKRSATSEFHGTSVDYNFGWDLLYRDVSNMFRFADQVNQRVKQLTAARGVSGSRGRLGIWEDVNYKEQLNQLVLAASPYIFADVLTYTHRRMWASVRWKADSPGLPSADQTLADARRIVHGWRLSPADVWELVPWSWFVDYFVNVGDYLEATTNSLGISAHNGCVMLETQTRIEHRIRSVQTQVPAWQVVPMECRLVTKVRQPTNPSLSFHSVPFLGPKQLVTLSAIAHSHAKYV